MLYILKDGHVNLSSAKRTSFYDEWYQGYDWNYREDILYQTYLGSASTGYYTSAGLKYKIFDNNIGYIRYESFSSGVGDGNLDEVLLYLATCNGLIIDVRDNGGGNLTNSTRIAARFTNEKTLTGYIPVSYTHLDVYKRQFLDRSRITLRLFCFIGMECEIKGLTELSVS